MAESDNLLWMTNPELANALRRRQEGAALMQQGMDASPIRSPWQGVARLGQALLGGYEARKGDEAITDYGKQGREDFAAALKRNDALGQPGGAAPAAPAQPAGSGGPSPQAVGAALSAGPPMSDDDALVRTVYGEARGETPLGQQAVAAVIRNRAAASGMSINDVVRAPGQFEPWGNPQTREQLASLDPNSPEYKAIAQSVLGTTNDPTNGATHFYSPTAQAALGRQPPAWATGQGADIGAHRFYNLPYSAPQTGSVQVAGPGAPTGLGATGPNPAQPGATPGQPATGAQAPQVQMAVRLMDEGQKNSTSMDPRLQRLGASQMQRAQFMMSLDTYHTNSNGTQTNVRTGELKYPPTPRMATDAQGNLIAVNPGGSTNVVSQGGANPGVNADANAQRAILQFPPNSPEYRQAYAHLYGEQTQQTPNGPVTYRPRTPPQGLAEPAMAGQGAPAPGGPAPAPAGTPQPGVNYATPVQPNLEAAQRIGVPVADTNPYQGMSADEQQKAKTAALADTRARFAKEDDQDRSDNTVALNIRRFQELNKQATTGPIYNFPGAKTIGSFSPPVQEMQAISAKLTPLARPPGSGATSDFEQGLYGKATVGIDKPREVNENIANAQLADIQTQQARKKFIQSYVEANGHEQGADRMWQMYLNANPILDPKGDGSFTLNKNRVGWQDWFRNNTDPQTGRMKDTAGQGGGWSIRPVN